MNIKPVISTQTTFKGRRNKEDRKARFQNFVIRNSIEVGTSVLAAGSLTLIKNKSFKNIKPINLLKTAGAVFAGLKVVDSVFYVIHSIRKRRTAKAVLKAYDSKNHGNEEIQEKTRKLSHNLISPERNFMWYTANLLTASAGAGLGVSLLEKTGAIKNIKPKQFMKNSTVVLGTLLIGGLTESYINYKQRQKMFSKFKGNFGS